MKGLTLVFCSLILAVSLFLPGLAMGQGADSVKTKFYNFDDMLIDGAIKKPTGAHIDVRDRVRFDRLLQLNKTFLPNLERSAKEQALK